VISLFGDYRGLPKDALYLIYWSVFPSVALGMFYTDISYYLTAIQGLSDTAMGTVMMVMGLSMVVASFPLGAIADHFGRKRVLIIGNIIGSIVVAVFALTTNLGILLVAAVIEGVSEGAFSASSNALLADNASDQKRNAVFSLSGFVGGVAFGAGGFVIPIAAVFEQLGLTTKDAHIALYVTLALLSLISTLFIRGIGEHKTVSQTVRGSRVFFPRKSRNYLMKYVISGAIIAFGAGLVVPLMTRWLGLAYGISDVISGPILGVSSMLIGVSALVAPRLAGKIGIVKAITVTQAFSTLFMLSVPFSPGYVVASLLYTVRSFLMNMAGPLQQSMIMGLVDQNERGLASGISSALWRLPNSLSTNIGAWLMGLGLLAEPFYGASVLYMISIVLFWLFFKDLKMPEEIRR
jgi:MFS family permease